MYPVLSTVLSISTCSAMLAECFKKRAKKPPLVLEQAKPEQPMDKPPQPKSVSDRTESFEDNTKKPYLVFKQVKPEQPMDQESEIDQEPEMDQVSEMDQEPEPNFSPWPFHFGLFYNILTYFDRRELCHLRNVNHHHYTVIESKFGITPPYLVSTEQHLNKSCWRWWPTSSESIEEMPFDVRNQLPVSKFVRFKSSDLLVCNPIESKIDVLSISHVWENQELTLTCAPNFVWNDEWACMAAKAKYLEVINGQDSITYLRQLISGNCVRLIFTDCNTTTHFDLPMDHVFDFLLQSNSEDTKSIEFR